MNVFWRQQLLVPLAAVAFASVIADAQTMPEPSGLASLIVAPPAPDVSPVPLPHLYDAPVAATCYSQANQDADAQGMLIPFYDRASHTLGPADAGSAQSPRVYQVWWDPLVRSPVGLAPRPLPVDVATLVQSALRFSPHIKSFEVDPAIQRTFLAEEAAAFDWRSFMEQRYDNTNDPVGNDLTTGNANTRFIQEEWLGRSGLRRRNRVGGEFEISQRFGYLDNNSRFLNPPQQGNSRLELNYTQPLLNGAGRAVNESLIVLADVNFHAAGDEFVAQLQDHLLQVTETYWELYRARAEFFQRQRLLQSAKMILANLAGRTEVDVLDRQVLRAKSAVANRQSEIVRAKTSIRNAESRLRLLVNDPALLQSSWLEMTPVDVPMVGDLPMTAADGIATALANRPDISQAIRELRASSVKLGVSRNQLLPQLDLLLNTYVAGLQGDAEVLQAFVNQYSDGRPGFTVGLQFEMPLGRRAPKAQFERRNLEMSRALSQFRATVETGLTEVEIALREVATTHNEMQARYQAMLASYNETQFLVDRWETLPGIDDSSTLLLEDLLDSQERSAGEEAAFVRAQVNYAIAMVRLRKFMGTLFRVTPNETSVAQQMELPTALYKQADTPNP